MLSACIGIGQWFLFCNESRPHQAFAHKILTVTLEAEVRPTDMPLRLDDAGASLTIPKPTTAALW